MSDNTRSTHRSGLLPGVARHAAVALGKSLRCQLRYSSNVLRIRLSLFLAGVLRFAQVRKSSRLLVSNRGYTIPELTVSIVVLGILIISLFSFSTYYFSSVTRYNAFVEMSVDSQNLLRATVEQLRYGAGVRQSNTITDSNAPAGGWNTSNTDFVIIIAVPAVDSNREYIIDSATGSPYNNELVYFKDGTTLYRRTLAQPDATGNTLKTSCPAALASPSCPPDNKLVENLDSMVFTLYDQDNASTLNPLLARSVKIDLGLRKKSFGNPLTLDNSIRVTLRNQF